MEDLKLPIIDLNHSDVHFTASSILKACNECGFFYLVNHGVEKELLAAVFEESRKFFSRPHEQKLRSLSKGGRGFIPLYAHKLDANSSTSKGDAKESFTIGPLLENGESGDDLNIWPREDVFPTWKSTMQDYYGKVQSAGKKLISLIALSLNMEEDFFVKNGAMVSPASFLGLQHYIGERGDTDEEVYGASAHTDFGTLTLLATDGVRGLQVCRDKFAEPKVWEDVPHIDGAFIVNIGDAIERWTNGIFLSNLHRVIPTGQERFSVVFTLDANPDWSIECAETCCSQSSPSRFPPVRFGDFLAERFKRLHDTAAKQES
ncbi:unnamed protein product [Cuscuta campestris]|uniref:feruloyl-CoA 6-hydroxylase n=1 Tax=Cuscuta campestris TaxID=132261 RepID=A0A484MRC0_9ASTE|nr:unnamed protein product [Cuscuta campestris]